MRKRVRVFLSDEQIALSRKIVEDALYLFITPVQMAKEMNISPTTVRCWLNGKNIISPQKALQLDLMVRERKEKIALIDIKKENLRPDIFR